MGFESAGQEPAPPQVSLDSDEAVEAWRARFGRRAIRMEIGGFAPPAGPAGSWFGRVNLALPGEEWPTTEGTPLHAFAQIDLTQLPFRPQRLDDVEMVTLFITEEAMYGERPNGEWWCLRAYPRLSALVPLQQVDTGSEIHAFPMRPQVVDHDYPNVEDALEMGLQEESVQRYFDPFPTADGFKLGGWPFLAQGPIDWAGPGPHPARPEFVFQIDSTDKGNWMWGDSGLGYFGRGTRPGRTDEWVMAWQCY